MAITQPTITTLIHTVLPKRNTQDSTLLISPSHPGSPIATRVQQPVPSPIHSLILESDERGIETEKKNTSKPGILILEKLGWEQPNLSKCGTMIDDLVTSMARSRYTTRQMTPLLHSIKGLRTTIDLDPYLLHHPFHPYLRSIGNQQLHPDLVQTSRMAISMADTIALVPDPEHNSLSIPMINLRKHPVRAWLHQTRRPCYLGFIPLNPRFYHLPRIHGRSLVERSRMVSVLSRRCR